MYTVELKVNIPDTVIHELGDVATTAIMKSIKEKFPLLIEGLPVRECNLLINHILEEAKFQTQIDYGWE